MDWHQSISRKTSTQKLVCGSKCESCCERIKQTQSVPIDSAASAWPDGMEWWLMTGLPMKCSRSNGSTSPGRGKLNKGLIVCVTMPPTMKAVSTMRAPKSPRCMTLTKINTAHPNPETVMHDQSVSGSCPAVWLSPSISCGCQLTYWTKTPAAIRSVANANQIRALGGDDKGCCMRSEGA